MKRSPVWLMPVEEFVNLVSSAESTTEMLAAFGLTNKGGNSRTLWSRIRHEGLDEDAIRQKTELNRKLALQTHRKTLTDEQVFCENSTCNRQNLKSRIRKRSLIPYVCAACECLPIWCGKELVLQLDHINGVDNDNRLENLRFLCPNCHSQTHSYAGRKQQNMQG